MTATVHACANCSDRQAAEGETHCCKRCEHSNGEYHDYDCEVRKDQKVADEENAYGILQKDVEGASKIHDAHMLQESVKGDEKTTNKRNQAWRKLRQAMRVDEESLQQHASANFLMGLVKMGFLAVIVGCELDLYAFIMSWPGYWNMKDPHNQIQGIPLHVAGTVVNFTVIKLLLLVGPVGYATAVLMYMNLSQKSPVVNHHSTEIETYAKSGRSKIELKYYHFTPLFRYYLLIKDDEPADIEGLFRVNALSTFTLGTAQIVCMLFHLFVLSKEATIFIKVGIFTQCWNLAVTFLYFLTPMSTWMMAAVAVETLKKNVEKDMMDLHREVLSAVETYSRYNSEENNRQKNSLSSRIDREIALLGGLADEDTNESKLKELHKYEVDLKVEALGFLRRIQYLKFAQIGK